MEDKRAGCPTWFLGGVAGLSGERLASSAISSATLSCCAWSNTYSRPNHSPPLVQFSLPSPILILVQSTWLWPTDLLLSEFLKLLGSLLTSLLPVCCAQPSQCGGDCRTVWGRRVGGHIQGVVYYSNTTGIYLWTGAVLCHPPFSWYSSSFPFCNERDDDCNNGHKETQATTGILC